MMFHMGRAELGQRAWALNILSDKNEDDPEADDDDKDDDDDEDSPPAPAPSQKSAPSRASRENVIEVPSDASPARITYHYGWCPRKMQAYREDAKKKHSAGVRRS